MRERVCFFPSLHYWIQNIDYRGKSYHGIQWEGDRDERKINVKKEERNKCKDWSV